jgi:hypothetical protein
MVGHYVRYVPTFYKGCKLNLLVNAAYIEAVTLGRSFCRIEDRFYLKPLEAGLVCWLQHCLELLSITPNWGCVLLIRRI